MKLDRRRCLWPLIGLLAIISLGLPICSGCSLIRVNGKAVSELASLMPAPIVEAPDPVRIIDWPELLALLGMGLGGIAHRYYYHLKHPVGG